ncbi:MAG: DUF2726 domain-containing protein [Amphritea sp.]
MDMFLYPLLMLIAVIIFAGFLKKALNNSDSGDESPSLEAGQLGYRQKGALFTPAERSFLGVLDQAIDQSKYRVFGKVRVADLIEPQPSRNRSQWQKAFNSIPAKHFDFVICNADDLTPVAVIELDDKSHNARKRQQRDELLESICKQVALPLIRMPAKRAYNVAELTELVNKRLGIDSLGAVETVKETNTSTEGEAPLVAER